MYYSSYEDFLIHIAQNYSDQYGTRKFNKIYSKITNSKKVGRLIENAKNKNAVPNQKDYLYCLNEIPFFIFSKADTLAMGCIFALARWGDQCNENNQLASNQEMLEIGRGIISECNGIKLDL